MTGFSKTKYLPMFYPFRHGEWKWLAELTLNSDHTNLMIQPLPLSTEASSRQLSLSLAVALTSQWSFTAVKLKCSPPPMITNQQHSAWLDIESDTVMTANTCCWAWICTNCLRSWCREWKNHFCLSLQSWWNQNCNKATIEAIIMAKLRAARRNKAWELFNKPLAIGTINKEEQEMATRKSSDPFGSQCLFGNPSWDYRKKSWIMVAHKCHE